MSLPYIARFDKTTEGQRLEFATKAFWLEAVAVYGIQGFTQLMYPFSMHDHLEILNSMALITVFTMMFVTLLAFINVKESQL